MEFRTSLVTPDTADEGKGNAALAGSGVYDLIIIGGGPAGLTAAVYACRSGMSTLVLSGHMPGGQIANTERIENFPGFPDGINGAELAERLQAQAERFGATIKAEGVREVDFAALPMEVRTSSGTHKALSVIIATGTFPRHLGVPGEREFYGRGVSTCATCDGFFYRDRKVIVVGGGDSALEEGLFLTKFASEVVIIHRRDELRASTILQARAFANPKVRFVWDSVVEEILGDQVVKGVRVRNVKSGELSEVAADGVFVFVGLIPATKIFHGHVAMDDLGYIVTDRKQQTSAPGVSAAGDVQNADFRQCVVAAGSGAMAAMQAYRYLVGLTPHVSPSG
ncbi:MAG: thioredoxin-disulfide reductase [Anaerolineales bacterium]|nr:thioredoxin-disulfide reductase [Anaerolineales bacterium]